MSTVLQNKKVTIRKPHRCWGCLREFPSKTEMIMNVTVDTVPFTSYWCKTCEKIIHDIGWDEFEDGIGKGELIDNYPDYYKEGGEGWIGKN